MKNQRDKLKNSRRWIIKIGSSLLTRNGVGLNVQFVESVIRQIIELKKMGIHVVLVSSGAVSEGVSRLGWTARPTALHDLQAAAAVGQMGLIQAFESIFQQDDIHTAQILLTHEDLADRQRYLNARNTLKTLLDLGVVPVINENDSVASDELRFGDNDTLAGLIANLIEADVLVLLTDQEGMFEQDPRVYPDARLISEAAANDDALVKMASAGGVGKWGSGGMLTKIRAAKFAARSGAMTLIAAGNRENVLTDIYVGEQMGTLIVPAQEPMAARKQWMAGQLQVCGQLVLDDGAVSVLKQSGRSLLPVGVKQAFGTFEIGELVACVSSDGKEVARGLVNYSALETARILGKASDQIESLLGYIGEPELIHRDNLVLTD